MGNENNKCTCCANREGQDSMKLDNQNGFISEPTMIPKKGIDHIVDQYSTKDLKLFAEHRANSIISLNPNEKSMNNNNFLFSKENSRQSILKNGMQFTLNPQETISNHSSHKKEAPSVSFFTLQSKSNYRQSRIKEENKADVTIIQSFYRGYSYRKRYQKRIKKELTNLLDSLLKTLYQSYLTDNLKQQESNMGIVHNDTTYQRLYSFEMQKKGGTSQFLLSNIYNRKTTMLKASYHTMALFTRLAINPKEMSFYIGEITIKNEKHGKGVLYTSQGCKYEGDWEYDNFTGNGKYIDKEGSLYEGYFYKGLLTGKGEKKMLNDCSYSGLFVNSIRSGKGKEKTPEHIYEGEFLRDLKNGKGKLSYILIHDEYEGNFEDNMINGKGRYQWSNGEIYEGTFINGKMHGKGLYKWPDGGEYEGEYINNVKEGQGRFKWSDNKIYTGEFKNGRPCGKGLLDSRGKKYNAVFKAGKLISKTEL